MYIYIYISIYLACLPTESDCSDAPSCILGFKFDYPMFIGLPVFQLSNTKSCQLNLNFTEVSGLCPHV